MIIPRTADDWTLYYGNSYFKIKEKDKWKWIRSTNFEKVDDGIFRVHYSLEDGKRYFYDLNTKEMNFDLSYPDCHYYFLDGEALLLYRKPVRSSVKTLSGDNAGWLAPINEVMPANFQWSRHGQSWIKRLAQNLSDFPFETARKMVNDGKAITAPMKKEWAVSLSPFEKYDQMLWFRSTGVGLLKKDTLHVMNPIFQQEIADNFGNDIKVVAHGA